ncbi:MAG: O-antigen ligase family protein, partial [Chloroflexi bacterium]|nr:O-antigen ligase family protein [Chloroflexota bacterium]
NVLEPVLLYFLLVSTWREERQVASAVKALVAGGAVVATYGLYQWLFTGDVITAEGVRRMLATYRSPNNLGLYLERIIPWSLALAWSAGRWRKIYLGALGSLALALFLTFSVGAWLGAAGGLFATSLFLFKGRKALATVLILGLLAGGLALPILRVERVISHLSFRQETTTFLRLQVWQASANMIRDHPLLGVGLDGFLEQYRTRYIRPEAWKEPNLSHPHNLILELWVNLGVPGVVILVLFLWGFYRRASHLYHRVPEGEGRAMLLGAMGAMTAAMAHGLVDRFYFGAPDLAYVFFLALAVVEMATPVECRRKDDQAR